MFPAGDVPALTKQINEALQAPADEEHAGAQALSERVTSIYSWERAAADPAALYQRLLARRGSDRRARLGRGRKRAGQPVASGRA